MSKMILEYKTQIVEAKADIERFRQWIVKGGKEQFFNDNPTSEEQIDKWSQSVVDTFLNFRSRLKSPYNDLYYWIKNDNFSSFYDYLRNLQAEDSNKKQVKQHEQEGAELIYSDDKWKVYHIINFEASAKYGKNTKWCITGTERWANGGTGEDYFKNYHDKEGVEFYFYIRSNTEKYALAVYPDKKHYEIFNAEDVTVPYIEDAPTIEGLPDVSTKDDSAILLNAIMSQKINDDVLMSLMTLVLTTQKEGTEWSVVTNDAQEMSDRVAEMIPDDWVEHEAVASDEMTPEEYKQITGDDYEEEWGGDVPILAWDSIASLKGRTKKEKCDVSNFTEHKYWLIDGDVYQWGAGITSADDFIGIYYAVNSACNFDDWDDFDVSDYFNGDERKSKMDLLASHMASFLIDEIQHGRISKSVISNIGLSQEYLDSITVKNESLKEDVSNDVYYHGSSEKFDSFSHEIQWFSKDYEYAKYYALATSDKGYVYHCNLKAHNLFDIGRTGVRVYTLMPIKPYVVTQEMKDVANKLKLSDEELNKLLSEVEKEWSGFGGGYKMFISTVARSKSFRELLIKKGYDGVKAIEYNVPAKRYCETYGIYDSSDIDILKVDNVFFNKKESFYEAKAITFGDLDYGKKTDTRGIQMNGRGTGHFGTGFYFVGKDGPYGLDKDGNIKYDYNKKRPVYEIDLDAYKLFRPKDNDTAYQIHDAMRDINNGYGSDFIPWLFKNTWDEDKLEDELYQIGWDAQSVYEAYEDDDLLDLDVDLSDDDLKELEKELDDKTDEEKDKEYEELCRSKYAEFVKKYQLEDYVGGYNGIEYWLKNEKLGKIEQDIKNAINRKGRDMAYVEHSIKYLADIFNKSVDEMLSIVDKCYKNDTDVSTVSTQIFKAMGYEGVDVTHLNHDAQGLSGLDNFSYGTVIYDLKPGTYKRIIEPRVTEALEDDKSITVYRVGELNDDMMFFTDSLDYFDKSDTGYSKEEAKKYKLNLENAKVWNPIEELDLDVNTWSAIWGKVSDFEKFGIDYEYTEDQEEDDEYALTDTDYLADAGKRLGYDVIILKDIPNDHGYGKDYTEYAVCKKDLVSLDESCNEGFKEDKTYELRDGTSYRIWTEEEGYGRQTNAYKVAYKGDNWLGNDDRVIRENILGVLEYAYDDEDVPYIQMIEVNQKYRHEGIAHNMLRELQHEFPNAEINWGMTTDDGSELYKHVTELVNGKVRIKEAVDASDEEILDALDKEFGQDKIHMWSTFILPNGHCLNPDNSKDLEQAVEEGEFDIAYEHSDFLDWLWWKFEKGETFMEKYCCKMNVTYPYICIPKDRITPAQLQTVRNIINNGEFEYNHWDAIERYQNITGHEVSPFEEMNRPLVIESTNDAKIYDLSYVSADEIIKDIQEFYRTGFFLENFNKLNEDLSGNTFMFGKKKCWSGSVNLLDGVIEEVHSYAEAKRNDFHHSFYFSETQVDKMTEGECAFFYVDEDKNVYINPMSRDAIEFNEKEIIDKIKTQIKMLDESIKEARESNTFEAGTAGYIKDDGTLIFCDEYHGEDSSIHKEKYPEFSNTHSEEDTCVRIYKEPNDIQYKKLEEIIDSYLDSEGYCKVEIWSSNDTFYHRKPIFYNVYSLYDNACQDIYYDEKVGNWTGYKLVQIIKNQFKDDLKEQYEEPDRDKVEKLLRKEFTVTEFKNFHAYLILEDGTLLCSKFHPDMTDYLCDSKKFSEDEMRFIDSHGAEFLVNFLHCIRATIDVNENYISLPAEKVTEKQFSKLLELIDADISFGNKEIAIVVDSGSRADYADKFKVYSFEDNTSDDIIKKIKRYYTTHELVESLEKDTKIYRGESDNTLSRKFNNASAGLFFGDMPSHVEGWGEVSEYEIIEPDKIYDAKCSSDAYCTNNDLYSKEYKELSDTFKMYADIKKLDDLVVLFKDENKRNELNKKVIELAGDNFVDYDVWTWCLQLVAKIDLESKGYKGACWQDEDFGNRQQYQIWDSSCIKKTDNYDFSFDDNYGIEIEEESLTEAREELTDEKIRQYVAECVDTLKDAGFQDATMLDIKIEQMDTTKTFGQMVCKKFKNGSYTLRLSKYLFDEPEETIKNTIYHELCHYLQYKKAFRDEAFYFNDWGQVKARRDMYSDYGGHGRVWKEIAKEVGEYTNQNITRTNSYSMHTEVGKAYDDKIKYVVKCKHCGREFKYTKMTKFIRDVIDGEGHSDNWWCCCDDGTKSHDFEIVKGK